MQIVRMAILVSAVAGTLSLRVVRPLGAVNSVSTAAAAAPRTIEVQMIGDATGYRFSPATITIKRGDRVRWTLVSGPPHNVVFWSDSIPKGAAAKLTASMPQATAPLTGPFFMTPGQSYVVTFDKVPSGTYRYYCTPHLALGMAAMIKVQ
jgi:plastocyanin